MEVVHVRPHNKQDPFPLENLLSKVEASIIEPVTLKVPIPKGLDINQAIQENEDKFQTTGPDDDMEVEVNHLVDISELNPQNLMQQVCTVILRNFKVVKDHLIERIFNTFATDYQWSKIGTDSITIFLRLSHLGDLKRVIDNVLVFDDICDEVLYNLYGIELDDEPFDRLQLQATISSILTSSKYSQHHKSQKTEEYQSYKIDNNELIEVPNSMKELIIQELIRFRSRMLIKEQEKRDKELADERIKSKKLLNSLFSGNLDVNVDVDVDTAVKEPAPEMPELSDEQYEAHLKKLQLTETQRLYDTKIKLLVELRVTMSGLRNKLESLNGYEDNLIDNKLKYIDDVKAQDSTLHSFSDYLRLRAKRKQREEQMDDADRETGSNGSGGDPTSAAADSTGADV